MALIGNTIKIVVSFKSWQGGTSQVESGTIKVYNKTKTLLSEIPFGITNLNADGDYEVEYVVPDGVGDIVVEAYGQLEGSTILGRKIIKREWV